MAVVSAEVIIRSSPCSVTCGLGVQTQMLCAPRDGQSDQGLKEALPGVKDCRVRRVKCLDSWQCGLQVFTVITGQRFEMHCLGAVREALGPFSYRVSWGYAPGVITSDDSLFSRWGASQLDRLVMDSVTEEHAGGITHPKLCLSPDLHFMTFSTYRCDVQDRAFHRVKRLYSGIRVLPAGVLSLDYSNALARWGWVAAP
ncbi:transmembrane protein 81 [Aplochiton taeniatus]